MILSIGEQNKRNKIQKQRDNISMDNFDRVWYIKKHKLQLRNINSLKGTFVFDYHGNITQTGTDLD